VRRPPSYLLVAAQFAGLLIAVADAGAVAGGGAQPAALWRAAAVEIR